jgi:hypothetical protein
VAFRLILRKDAAQYSETVIVSSAVTLLGVRLFLELTGYPQIASGGLHIAHVLWGGLLLLAGALLALMFRNRPLLVFSAWLTGAGWGLFIDEIGKFVTVDYDYFFRPAAPIIYSSFLVLWLLVLRIRRYQPQRTSDRIYHILDGLEEVIEASVDPEELAVMQEQLRQLSSEEQDGVTDELARALLSFVQHEEIKTQEAWQAPPMAWLHRVQLSVDRVLLSPRSTTYGFPLLLVLSALGRTVYAWRHLLPLVSAELAPLLHADLDVSPFASNANMFLFLLVNTARLTLALLLLLSAYWIFRRQDRGWELARLALVLAIVVLDLLVFYFTQFSAAVVALTDVALLGWVNHYQWRKQLGVLGSAEAPASHAS